MPTRRQAWRKLSRPADDAPPCRLQFRIRKLGTSANPAMWLSIAPGDGTSNNGTLTQSYEYDALNRLTAASENTAASMEADQEVPIALRHGME